MRVCWESAEILLRDCCETAERLLGDCWEFADRLLRDCWETSERLLRDCWETAERLLRDCWETSERLFFKIYVLLFAWKSKFFNLSGFGDKVKSPPSFLYVKEFGSIKSTLQWFFVSSVVGLALGGLGYYPRSPQSVPSSGDKWVIHVIAFTHLFLLPSAMLFRSIYIAQWYVLLELGPMTKL